MANFLNNITGNGNTQERKSVEFLNVGDVNSQDKWVWVNGDVALTSEKVFLYQSNWTDKNTGKARSRDVFGRRVTLTSGN